MPPVAMTAAPPPPTPVPSDSSLFEQYLAARDEACPSCGYNLRSLKGHHCPECGQALRLHVGLVHPNLASYIAGLIAIAGSLGFGGVTLLWFIIFTILMGPGPPAISYVLLIAITIVSSALLSFWLRRSGWIRRQPKRTRTSLVIAMWVYAVIIVGAFIATFDV